MVSEMPCAMEPDTIAADRPTRYGKTVVFIRSGETAFEKTALQVL